MPFSVAGRVDAATGKNEEESDYGIQFVVYIMLKRNRILKRSLWVS